MHSALPIDGRVVLTDGEERHPPAAASADVEELVDRPRRVLGRSNRIAGHHRRPANVDIGHERATVVGEVVVLVAAKREVVERVVAPGADDLLGSMLALLARRLGLDEGAEDQIQEQERPEDSEDEQRGVEKIAEHPVVVDVGTAAADQSLVGRAHVAAQCQIGVDVVSLGKQGDDGEGEHSEQVQGDEGDCLGKRPAVGLDPEVVAEPDQRQQHRH